MGWLGWVDDREGDPGVAAEVAELLAAFYQADADAFAVPVEPQWRYLGFAAFADRAHEGDCCRGQQVVKCAGDLRSGHPREGTTIRDSTASPWPPGAS